MGMAGVGTRVSGMTATRTGITYAIDYDERRGYRIKAGAFLKMNGQALFIDEAQDIDMKDLKTLADGIDRGEITISRIQGRTFKSETRTIFCCNPVDKYARMDQATMDSFFWGCRSVMGIFPKMMIRRCDLFVFVTTHDIEDKSLIFNPPAAGGPPRVSPQALRALIHWAWNLSEEDIEVSEEVAQIIRAEALTLSNRFGLCEDLPIVSPEDYRKTLARLTVATAVLDCSTKDWRTLVVEPAHVKWIARLLEQIYAAENCTLDEYSEQYRRTHGLDNYEELEKEVLAKLNHPDYGERYRTYLDLFCKPDSVRLSDLVAQLGVSNRTVQSDTSWFKDRDFLTRDRRGYLGTGKMIRFLRVFLKRHPETLAKSNEALNFQGDL